MNYNIAGEIVVHLGDKPDSAELCEKFWIILQDAMVAEFMRISALIKACKNRQKSFNLH
jgi:hypothetical protein